MTNQRSIYQYFVLNVEDDEGVITKYWRFTAPIVDSGRLSWILTYLEAIDCGANYYLDEVALQCSQCEYPTKTSPDGAGYTCDACYDGFYVDGDGLCQPCPSGGVCEGGLAQPYPKRGHWGLKDHPTEFLECDQGDACLGGPNFECKEGYRGRMCERMDNDEFRVAGTQHRCPASKADQWLGTAGMVAGVVVLWHVINSIVCTYSDVTDMLLMTVQQCAIVFEFDLDWPASLAYLDPLFEVALFDVDLVQPNCVVHGWTYYDGFYVQLMLPILYSLLYFAPIFVRFAVHRHKGRSKTSLAAALHHYDGFLGPAFSAAISKSLTILDICHTTIAVKTLEPQPARGRDARPRNQGPRAPRAPLLDQRPHGPRRNPPRRPRAPEPLRREFRRTPLGRRRPNQRRRGRRRPRGREGRHPVPRRPDADRRRRARRSPVTATRRRFMRIYV